MSSRITERLELALFKVIFKDLYHDNYIYNSLIGLEDLLLAKKKEKLPSACLFFLDELSQFLSNIGKDTGTEANFLSLFSGTLVRSLTRAKQIIDIPNPRVSIVGFTQPATIIGIMDRSTADTGGFFERCVKCHILFVDDC